MRALSGDEIGAVSGGGKTHHGAPTVHGNGGKPDRDNESGNWLDGALDWLADLFDTEDIRGTVTACHTETKFVQQALRDSNGNPVFGPGGHLQTEPVPVQTSNCISASVGVSLPLPQPGR